MRTILATIDSINEWTAKLARWLCPAVIAVGVYDVVLRHVFNRPTIWAYELSMMLGGSIIILGWGYVHLNDGHVRIDILYSRLSSRVKSILDSVGTLIFLVPIISVLIYIAIP